MLNPSSPAIQAHAVTRRYGTTAALRGIDLAIERGRVTALLGPNGAGKTTFVDLVLGRGRPDSGSITTLGVHPGSTAARRGTGVMLQSAALAGQLTVREHLELYTAYYAAPVPLAEVLARGGLADLAMRRYSQLSGGQQRRVQFAAAICGRPQLLILDEPTVALDAEARRNCWNVIRECADAGAAVLLTTHLLEEAEALADRVVLLSKGRIRADGAPRDIRAEVSEQRIRCTTSLAAAEFAALPNVTSVTLDNGRLAARSTHAESTLRALFARDAHVGELEVVRATLEEALEQLMSREAA